MYRAAFLTAFGFAILSAVVLYATRAQPTKFVVPASFTADIARGKYMAAAAGCASCHTKVDGDPEVFSGGVALASPFGPIISANISSDKRSGIGSWSDEAFLNAVKNGVSPRGVHYYPAFPYARYAGLTNTDVLDIRAYLLSLPAASQAAPPTKLSFPFNLRMGLGVWKVLNAPRPAIEDAPQATNAYARGAYLVEHAAHCQECHTPRNLTLGLDQSRAFEGGTLFDGAHAPDLSPKRLRAAGYDAFDNVMAFGLRLDGASSIEAPTMQRVASEIGQLTDADRRAIWTYLTEREDNADETRLRPKSKPH